MSTASWNERIKLTANAVNNTGIGILGVAVLKPMADGGIADYNPIYLAASFTLSLHLFSHYILTYLE